MSAQRLGPYPIEREVGRGGMGVVYRGRDTRLDRAVAIKVLPEIFARDPERLARFEREARLLAALTHPNIAGIYGLEEADGLRFLVLEFVEGPTLSEHVRGRPLPVNEALDICRQIAGALEAAHEAGIIHRDLKPGNVKLTPAGEVKVLDFGLAKGGVGEAASDPNLSQSPTLSVAGTMGGVILGTAAYMSPEQARGKTVDRRTDIWSFGCVLYECLTGVQAFEGETLSDTIALILQGEPDWSRLPASTPPRLRALLARCLEKDARRRLRDIGDARIEIEELQGLRTSGASRVIAAHDAELASAAAAPAARSRRLPAALAAALVVAGAVAGIGAWIGLGPRPPAREPLRFRVQAPPGFDMVTDAAHPAISPDGRRLVFLVSNSKGESSLWLRPLGDFTGRELPGTRNAEIPFWSPDSKQVAFFADGKLKRLVVDGGTPQIICDAATGRGGAWSPKGVIVFGPSPTGPLFRVSASGGAPAPVTTIDSTRGETAHRWPCFLPDGEHFTFATLPAQKGLFPCYVGSLGPPAARETLLAADAAPVYAPPGYLVFVRNDALMAQRFDPGSRRTRGEPFVIGDPPSGTTYSAAPSASISRDGTLAWMSAGKLDMKLVWLDRGGHEVGTVGVPADRWNFAILSHDGRRCTVSQDVATGDADLWTVDLGRGIANRITYKQGKNTVGVWSPDDRTIVYSSTRQGTRDLYARAADGSGQDRLLYESSVPFKDPSDWSPDGRWIVMAEIGDRDGWNLLLLPAAGGSPVPYLATPFNETFASISPDGRWLLYMSDESGTSQAYVQSFPEPGHKQQVSKSGAALALWNRNGREIFLARPDGTLNSVAVEPGPELRFGEPRPLFTLPVGFQGLDPAPDGQRFLAIVPAERTVPGISVAVDWRAGRETR